MKIKTSELIGAQLDLAAAKAAEIPAGIMGGIVYRKDFPGDTYGPGPIWNPSADWSQGGPLIEKFGVMLIDPGSPKGGEWEASTSGDTEFYSGPTPLIATMRAIVAAKLGEEVEVQEELV